MRLRLCNHFCRAAHYCGLNTLMVKWSHEKMLEILLVWSKCRSSAFCLATRREIAFKITTLLHKVVAEIL